MYKRAFFFDRDGVIIQCRSNQNYLPLSIRKFTDLKLTSGIYDIIDYLSNFFYIFVITNQPDVSRGSLEISELNKIHSFLMRQLKITEIFCCMHDDDDNCICRKPKTGMITSAIQKYEININNSYLVGDRWKDMLTAKNAGCKSIFLDYNYTESEKVDFEYDYKINDIKEIKKIKLW